MQRMGAIDFFVQTLEPYLKEKLLHSPEFALVHYFTKRDN